MAESLQLQFTVQGAQQVLPLTITNVASVFKTGSPLFGKFLGIPDNLINDPLKAAGWWIRYGKEHTWRYIIYNLDNFGKTGIADELIPYSEPPSDLSLTIERVTPIFVSLSDRTRSFLCYIIPDARAEVIHQSGQDERRQEAIYYAKVYPGASWKHLALELYQWEDQRAIEVFKAQLPEPEDSTLTVDNMLMATDDGVKMPQVSNVVDFGHLDMPDATYNGIVRNYGTGWEGRRKLFSEFLAQHPYPRWEVVVDLLKKLERKGKAIAGLAEEVKAKYMTMSDEKAQKIIERSVKAGSIKQRNPTSVVVGINGSGKSCLISRLFDEIPPEVYTSTGIVDQPCRGMTHYAGNLSIGVWKKLFKKDILELLAECLPAGMLDANRASAAVEFESEKAGSTSATSFSPSPFLPTNNHSTYSFSQPNFATSEVAQALRPEISHTSKMSKQSFMASKEKGNIIPPPSTPPTHDPLTPLSLPHSPSQSPTSEAMIRLVCKTKGSEQSYVVELLHMIDTGGQPEFMEVMPSLMHNSNLTLLVLNLAQSLDAHPEVAIYDSGIACKRPLRSALNNRQIAHQVVHTMIAKRSLEDDPSMLIVVGTHRDCVKGELSTTLAAVNKALKEIFLPSLADELIVYRSCNEIVFPVNSIHPDDDDNATFDIIRSKISEAVAVKESDTPFSFFIFEQDIAMFASQLERKVLSIDECMQVGEVLKMSQEEVQAALINFHERNIFVYFRRILPQTVFLSPQVPLDLFKAMVVFSYKVQSNDISGLPAKFSVLLKQGKITEEMLHHKSFDKYFTPGIYEPKHAIKLFSHLYAIAPLRKESSANSQQPLPAHSNRQKPSKEEYLMMCLLAPLPEEKIKEVLPTPSKVDTLLIHFNTECIPNGCFSSAIACAISQYHWTICSECVTHNVITLRPHNHPGKVTLVNSTHYLQIHVNSKNINNTDLNSLCTKVQTTVFSVLKKVFERMHFSKIEVQPAFLCPCGHTSEPHAAMICPESPVIISSYLVCSRTGDTIGDLNWRQQIWFEGYKEIMSQKPTLLQLRCLKSPSGEKVKIIAAIAPDWKDFGIYLDFDETGYTLDRIARDHPLDAVGCCTQMMKEWLEGRARKPATWATLISLLKDANLNVLAQKLERMLLKIDTKPTPADQRRRLPDQ